MASTTPKFIWCPCGKNKIPSKDSHELCVHCLGLQHAKEAVLEYGKCPHCAKMDWSMRINRLANVQEFMHRENQQQRKRETARCEPLSNCPSSVSEVTKKITSTPSSSTFLTVSSAEPLSFPLMVTVSSLPSNLTVTGGTHVSPASLQQPFHSTFALNQSSPFPTGAHAHKRTHSSRGPSWFARQPKQSHRHKCKCSPPCWDASDSCSCVRGPRSQRGASAVTLERQLIETVQQKLNSQQKAMQAQWSMMEKRIQALERLATDTVFTVSTETQTVPLVRTQQTEQKDCTVPFLDWAASIQLAKKLEDHHMFSSVSLNEERTENMKDEDQSLLPDTPLKIKDMLIATKLQELIGRAAKYLGIDFPHTTDLPDPTVMPEFEDFVQSTWSNPACARPFRPVHAEMYRLHECQAPAYDHMPQITSFMSAIFQAVGPMENKEASMPAKSWRFTESLAERVYQTAGMLVRTANYLRYLSDYQKHLLLEVSEEQPFQNSAAVLNELKLIAKFMLQLSSHQAELSGRAMGYSVAIRRHIWMAKTNSNDDLKATVADLPFVVSHTFGSTDICTSSNRLCKEQIL